MEKKQELENQITHLSNELKNLSQQDIDTEDLQKLVSTFLINFPSVAEYEDYHGEAHTYGDSAYVFFGIVNSMLCKFIESNQNTELVTDIIKWTNNVYNNQESTENVRNLIAVEFFEKSDESKLYGDFLKSNFVGKIAEDYSTYKAV